MDLGIGGLGYATEIGAGASAIVYRARQLDLDREVAVKVLSVTDEAFVRRFRREAKTLGKLSQNPGIVTVYDTGVSAAGQPFLILELCSSSVLDHLNDVGVFDPMVACQAGAQVADAVGEAHQNGVVHRDLKPGNVLVSQTGRYMVTDFGISTVTGATMGQTNSVGFTAGYVAPETLTGEPVGAPSDVYALGATLFHMVAGQAPFVAEGEPSSNLLALAQRVVNDPVPDLREKGIPEAVCEAIEAAMAKKPEDRPTAPELRDRLYAIAGKPAPAVSSASMFGADNETTSIPDHAGNSLADLWTDSSPEGPQVAIGDGTVADATVGMDAIPSNQMAVSKVGGGAHDIGRPPQPPPPSGAIPSDSAPQPPMGERNILDDKPSPQTSLGPTPEERRYLYTEDDRRQIGPLIAGAIVGLVALIAFGAFLINQSGGDSDDSDDVSIDTAEGTTSTASASGNDSTGQGSGSGGRGNLDRETTSTSGPTTSIDAIVNVSVPDVSGLSAAAAAAELTNVGLVVNQVDEESASVPVGTVIRQMPAAEATVPSGEVISIYVSAAGEIETVDVPTVVGLTLIEAKAALTDAGLTSTIVREHSDSVDLDSIISSSPDAGTTVNADSSVVLTVSDGPAPAQCADVIDLTEAAATSMLEAAGLTVSSTSQASTTVANGHVISCTEAPTTASLVVSSGSNPCDSLVGMTRVAAKASLEGAGLTVVETATISETVAENQVLTCTVTGTTATITYAVAVPATCPAVAGDTVAAANAALTAAGFADIVQVEAVSATVPVGMVISCTVSGATATITVSIAAADIAVPDIAGMTTANGSATLVAAGLTVGPVQMIASTLPAGEVIQTTPAAATEVAPGTSITIVVSDGGPTTVAVPNVVGSTQLAASAAITSAGLVPVVLTTPMPAGSAAIGTVVGVSPIAGTSVAVGSTVTITVAILQ